MTDYQRIFVVGAQAGADEVARLRSSLGSDVVVLTAPTVEAKRVVTASGSSRCPTCCSRRSGSPTSTAGTASTSWSAAMRCEDRFRDVVVVTDPATVTLLLRALAPTSCRWPAPSRRSACRAARVPYRWCRRRWAAACSPSWRCSPPNVIPIWVLPLLVVVAGLVLLLVPRRRHLGEALLIAVAVAAAVSLLSIAGSSRFPGSW